jgi:hypothetical protein
VEQARGIGRPPAWSIHPERLTAAEDPPTFAQTALATAKGPPARLAEQVPSMHMAQAKPMKIKDFAALRTVD